MTAKLEPVRDTADADLFDRIGIVLRGAKEIAAYMRVSPATIVRWRRRFRGREEYRLCFPAFLVPTGRGYGLQLWSHTALIKDWMDRWSQIDCVEAQGKAKWRRRTPRMKRGGEMSKQLAAGQFEDKTEQTPYARHAHKCPTVCEEPSELGPTNPAQREELGVKVGEMPAASQASKEPCPCGVPSRCLGHNEWPLEEDGAQPIYEEPPVKVEIRSEPSGAAELPPAKVSKNVRPEGCTCGNQMITCTAHD
jgi:hypothetical protein